MGFFKRFSAIAACTVFAALSFSGCNLFGDKCRHKTYQRGSDERSHYKICDDCGAKYDVENHIMNISYSASDKTQHFMQCAMCGYRDSYQPHDFSEWNYTYVNSMRRCQTKGCGYEEQCNHFETQKYVVSDYGHHTVCTHCNKKISDETAHIFNVYSDLTQSTHALSCKCGKIYGEAIPHDLQFEHDADNDNHWKVCECGYETEKEACTYGDFVAESYGHYRVCSVCDKKSLTESHNYKLSPDRKRLCSDCSYEKEKYVLLIGTWAYNLNFKRHKLTLNSDWTYTLYTGGIFVEQGDYDVYNYFVGLKGDITGSISLFPSDSYDGKSIEFKFQSGVTNKFTDSDRITYVKQ